MDIEIQGFGGLNNLLWLGTKQANFVKDLVWRIANNKVFSSVAHQRKHCTDMFSNIAILTKAFVLTIHRQTETNSTLLTEAKTFTLKSV